MAMSAADSIIALGHQLSAEKEAAHDLWIWLPSYKVTEKNHGDYVSEFTPNVKDVLMEAAMYMGVLKSPLDYKWTLDDREWFERCTCGKDHVGE